MLYMSNCKTFYGVPLISDFEFTTRDGRKAKIKFDYTFDHVISRIIIEATCSYEINGKSNLLMLSRLLSKNVFDDCEKPSEVAMSHMESIVFEIMSEIMQVNA